MPKHDIRPRKPTGNRRRVVPGEQFLSSRANSPFWWYDFQIDGTRFRGSCGTADWEQAAAVAYAEQERQFKRIRLGIEPPRPLTLNDAFVRFYREVAQGTSYGEAAQKHQMARMKAVLGGDTPLSSLTDARVSDLVNALRFPEDPEERKAVGPATVNRYLTTLSAICKRAREVWGAEVGPWERKKHLMEEPEGREVFLTKEQARDVLMAATPHIRPVMLLDLITGFRKANVVRLDWSEVNLDDCRITVIQKGGTPHSVPLPPEGVALLCRMEPVPEKRRGPVFYYGNPSVPCDCPACSVERHPAFGRAMDNPKRSIATAFRKAGLLGVRFHDLRHTHASWLLAATGNLKMVQAQLGHAQIETTMRYAHLEDRARADGARAAIAGLTGPAEVKKDEGAA